MLRYYISPCEVKRFFNTTHWYDFFKIQRVIHLYYSQEQSSPHLSSKSQTTQIQCTWAYEAKYFFLDIYQSLKHIIKKENSFLEAKLRIRTSFA